MILTDEIVNWWVIYFPMNTVQVDILHVIIYDKWSFIVRYSFKKNQK